MPARYTGPGVLRLLSYLTGIAAAATVYWSRDLPAASREKPLMAGMVLVAITLVLFILHYAKVIYSGIKRARSSSR